MKGCIVKRLLVVDDEKIFQKMVAFAVQSLDFEIATADDGMAGLEVAQRFLPHVIICDVMMPNLDGYQFIRQLRRNSMFSHVPILVLTSQSELNEKLEAFEAGADDHMTKPFEPAELVARIQVLLRRQENLAVLLQAKPALEKKAKIIAVHSLRGGVGCSSLAVNLGIALHQIFTVETLIMDLVLTTGQIALMLNATLRRTWADICHVKPEELDWDALKTIIGKHDSGVHFIAAPTYPTDAEMFTPTLFSASMNLLHPNFDYIVVDLPHNFGDFSLNILDHADWIIGLLAPDLASARATAAALSTYRQLGYPQEKIKLVMNWLFNYKGITRKALETALKQPIDWIIPHAPDLFIEAINTGRPFVYSKGDDDVSIDLCRFAGQLGEAEKFSGASQ